MEKVYHPYHLVDPSPWPYVMGCSVLLTTLGSVIYFHYSSSLLVSIGLSSVCLFLWMKDMISEGTYQGLHTKDTLNGLKMGFMLFTVSEVLFFFSFLFSLFVMVVYLVQLQ